MNWSDSTTHVKLPFKDPRYLDSDVRWAMISSAVIDLKSKCETFQKRPEVESARYWFRDAVYTYNEKARQQDFNVIQEDNQLTRKLIGLLPNIIDHALSLPTLVKQPIDILKGGRNQSVVLKRNAICSLIANAFLCTFPKQDTGRKLPYFSFRRLFHDDGENALHKCVKREKIKCFLEYFDKMGDGNRIQNTGVSFEKVSLSEPRQRVNWANSKNSLSPLQIISGSRIEDSTGMLQVDFANKFIGGGVLSDGAVQEEIRFCINPELLAARLFTEALLDYDVLFITGSRQFSDYEGYGSSVQGETFRFKPLDPNKNNATLIRGDPHCREFSKIVAMDATNFVGERDSQFIKDEIDRELHKCHVGFNPQGSPNHFATIATGNWGCGAYKGDPELKFLIQWLAASYHNRPLMYHVREEQKSKFEELRSIMISKGVTAGKLYEMLVGYNTETAGWGFGALRNRISVFEFVVDVLHK